MRWTTKSRIQRCCARLPGGQSFYFLLQRYLGGLKNPDGLRRLRTQQHMARLLKEHAVAIEGAEVLEVGTGWVPLIPIGFWICGAKRVRTYDLHAYFSKSLLKRALGWMSRNRRRLEELWDGLVERPALNERLDAVGRLADHPTAFLRQANIEYFAPGDAARTGLPDGSIDIHYSAHVFEHIPADVLRRILVEAHRLLRPGGASIHSIDPTDHFAHIDPTITTVNFLQFEEDAWRRYNDNQFAYHNRLRSDDYVRLFRESPLTVAAYHDELDDQALEALRNGFPLATPFQGKEASVLCRTNLDFVALRS